MALSAKARPSRRFYEHQFLRGPVWIMATHAGQPATAAQALLRRGDRMPADRVSQLEFFLTWVTPQAEFIRRLVKHEVMVGRMRVMACDATCPGNDTVNIRGRRFSVHQTLLVAVAGDAEVQLAIRPKLVTVARRVGVVTKGAAAEFQDAMYELARQPSFFTGMATEAEVLAFDVGEADTATGTPDLKMTIQALPVDRGTVPPWPFLDNISVAIYA